MVYAQDGRPRHHAQRAHATRGPRTLLPHRRARCSSWPTRRCAIEDHYSRRAGQPTPMDVEWAQGRRRRPALHRAGAARDGRLAARAGHRRRSTGWTRQGRVRVSGRAVGGGIASGRVRVVSDVAHLAEFQPGEVLVADTTMPDWGTVMKIGRRRRHQPRRAHLPRGHRRARARHPGRGRLRARDVDACAPATRSPCRCAEGATGQVYEGRIPFTKTSTDLSTLARPRTHLMVNLGNPDLAFQTGLLPNDGVGLARMEFIVAEHIKVHPMALVHPERVTTPRCARRSPS